MNETGTSSTTPGRLARAAGWTALGLVVIGLVRAAARIGADRFFGETGLAVITAGMAVATIATIPGAAGLTAGVTKLTAELRGAGEPATARRFVAFAARITTLLSVAGALAAMGYAAVDRVLAGAGTAAIAGTGLVTLAFGLYLTGKAIAYGEDAIGAYVRRELLGAVLFVAAGGVLVAAGSGPYVLLPVAAAYLGVGSIALARLTGRSRPRRGLPVRDFAGYGIVGAVGAAAGVGFTYVTPLVAGFVGGVAGAALIGASLTLLEPLYLAPRAISLVLLPRISATNARGNRADAAAGLHVGTAAVVLLAAPVCALLALERDRVLQLVFGGGITGGATLGWFSLAVFISVAGAPAVTALAATDLRRATIPMVASLVGFAAAAAVWVVAAPHHGTAAIAAGYALGSLIQVAAPIVVASRRYRPPWSGMWVRAGLATALVAGAAVAAAPTVPLDAAVLVILGVLLLPELRMLRAGLRPRRH